MYICLQLRWLAIPCRCLARKSKIHFSVLNLNQTWLHPKFACTFGISLMGQQKPHWKHRVKNAFIWRHVFPPKIRCSEIVNVWGHSDEVNCWRRLWKIGRGRRKNSGGSKVVGCNKWWQELLSDNLVANTQSCLQTTAKLGVPVLSYWHIFHHSACHFTVHAASTSMQSSVNFS